MKTRSSINQEKIIETLELPKDLLLGFPLLSFTGNRELLIENHRGITDYSTEKMVILAKDSQILIQGTHLCVDYYTKDTIKICGYIRQVEFVR